MNWSNFFKMGGYAFYVWGSYLVALVVMGGEVILVLKRRKALEARLAQQSQLSEGGDHENKA
jgi:heme exporter protein D